MGITNVRLFGNYEQSGLELFGLYQVASFHDISDWLLGLLVDCDTLLLLIRRVYPRAVTMA
jgi:hypothetical protein